VVGYIEGRRDWFCNSQCVPERVLNDLRTVLVS